MDTKNSSRTAQLLVGIVLVASMATPVTAASTAGIRVVGDAADRHVVMVDWAEGLFAGAGLGVPSVTVSFHDSREGCRGAEGHFSPARRHLDICANHDKPHVEDEWQRRTLVHELAHAWADEFIDERSRESFMTLRGVERWNDHSDAWGERGTEHAAEIMSWAIIDFEIHMWKLPDNTCEAMEAGYETLTGLVPAAGLTDSCD